MPKKPVKIVSRDVGETLTGSDVEYIEQGFCFAGFHPPDPAKVSRLWPLYKKSGRLKEYIEKHPGRRPALFWKWEVKEAFKVLGQSSRPAPFPNKGKWIVSPVVETQLQTLERLGLLQPSEKELALEDIITREALQRQKILLLRHRERCSCLHTSKFIDETRSICKNL